MTSFVTASFFSFSIYKQLLNQEQKNSSPLTLGTKRSSSKTRQQRLPSQQREIHEVGQKGSWNVLHLKLWSQGRIKSPWANPDRSSSIFKKFQWQT